MEKGGDNNFIMIILVNKQNMLSRSKSTILLSTVLHKYSARKYV